LADIFNIEEYRHRSRRAASCYCEAVKLARETVAAELHELYRAAERPRILALESLDAGIPAAESGWDLIHSAELLNSLPAAAAMPVIKTAMSRLKPEGRLFMANLTAKARFEACPACRHKAKNYRNETEMSDLAGGLAEHFLTGQAIFRDPSGLNVFLEVYKGPYHARPLQLARAVR